MSSIQSGEIVNRIQSVPLAPLVKDVFSDFELEARSKGMRLETDIPPDFPKVPIDPFSFRELLNNLVSNAIKYGRRDGLITVRAREKTSWVVLDVEDNGIGMDEIEVPFLFEQFYRGKSPDVREQRGTGLGLTIVQKIVNAHGGKIEVSSTPGKGSTFSICLNK
jgi:two-component system, OmpR family, phosphate regulon sensor histidine kinase PhoR